MKNVKVREETWINLMMIKYRLGKATVSEVVEELLRHYKKRSKS